MAFQVSPGVQVREVDLTNVVPAVSTSIGAIAGSFQWGPVEQVVQVSSEKDLVAKFGRPDNNVYSFFLNAAQFLQYAGDLRVVRADSAGLKNASSAKDSVASITVDAAGTSYTSVPTVSITGGSGTGATATATLKVVTVTPTSGSLGQGYAVGDTFTVNVGSGTEATFQVSSVATGGAVSGITILTAGDYTAVSSSLDGVSPTGATGSGDGNLTVDIVMGVNTITVGNAGSGYDSVPSVAVVGDGAGAVATAVVAQSGALVKNEDHFAMATLDDAGSWVAKYPGELGNSIKVVVATSTTFGSTEFEAYAGKFDTAPDAGEIHVAVVDEDGVWTGTADTVLETFAYLSLTPGAQKADGTNNYYMNVINGNSEYVWAANALVDPELAPTAIVDSLAGGANTVASTGELRLAYDEFADTETLDINLLIGYAMNSVEANYLIENIAEARKDVVAFVSPEISDTVGTTSAVDNVVAWADGVNTSSYGVMDSSALYVYDKYNDVYRWIPAAGTIAGLCANTDNVADAWFSPAGFNRGTLRNVVKLALNPKQAQRDTLYKKSVNPIVSFPGEGIVLYGDKTAQTKPSAFDRINVRRLFITIEKAIATAAKFQLFELNDEFTRAQFRNMVEPFLRDVQGRRGVTDFRVVCDETNNTGNIIDTNQFVADIYIKPARSINFISLNFVATRTGVDFNEIVG